MQEIQNIYRMLNWENDRETQREGMRFAEEIKDLSLLIMPPAAPSVWERCAQVLSKKTDAELEPYAERLLEWLWDLNWPGALTILERFQHFSGEKLKEPFVKCCVHAGSLDQEAGRMWLEHLSELLDNEELKKALPQPMIEQLQKQDPDRGVCAAE